MKTSCHIALPRSSFFIAINPYTSIIISEDYIILQYRLKSVQTTIIITMKVSLAYVFIAAIIAVVNSESNPCHRFLKAKASKVSKSKTSKSKSSKSDIDLCADKECPDNGCLVNTCNPENGNCEGTPDVTLCEPPPDSQCSERVCGDDGLCRIDDIEGSCDFEPGNLCKTGRCDRGECVEGTVTDCFTPDCIGRCIESTGKCEYSGESCDLSDNLCTPDIGTCDSSGTCVSDLSIGCLPDECQREVCDPITGCNAEDNTNNNGACEGRCCSGECCPIGETCCGGRCCLIGECTLDGVCGFA